MKSIPPMPQSMAEKLKSSPIPKGYVSADNKLTPKVVAKAKEILKTKSMGYTFEDEIDGVKYFFRYEAHYDDHISPGNPKWHAGVSVYTPSKDLESSIIDKDVAPLLGKIIDNLKKFV